MKNILAINGSARKNGNTQFLLEAFLKGAGLKITDAIKADELNLKYCTGCLRCNTIKRCAICGDEWDVLSKKILESDVLVFATPIYFHHVTAQLKKIIDRFRSYVHVQITETGLKHTPHTKWNKDFVLLLSLGSSNNSDAKPVIELFEFMVSILGTKNKLHVIIGTRLGVVNQVIKDSSGLLTLYKKLELPENLVENDLEKNRSILNNCFELGEKLSK